MWSYIRYAETPSIKRYGLMTLIFPLGLMSKPMLITLPFILLMMDYWPLRRLKFKQGQGSVEIIEKHEDKKAGFMRLVGEKIPLFLLTVGASIVTFINEKSGGTMKLMEDLSFSTRFNNAMVSYLEYLEKTLWPKGLSVFYHHPGNALAIWKGLLCGVALVSITAISIRLIKKAPYFAVGWFWYLGTLVPVIGIVQVGGQAMADRFTYVPLIGIFVIIAWGVPELLKEWHYRKNVLKASAGILILTLMPITWIQVSHWKSSITVFEHAIKVTDKKYPGFSVVHNNLGLALFSKQKIEEAISHYKMAIKINPYYADAHYNLGNAFLGTRRTKEAISHYKTAIKINPYIADAHYNLGNALLGARRTKEAIFHYKTVIMLNPDDVGAHYNLGLALAQKGDLREAINHYRETVRLRPDLISARKNLEMALLRLEKYEHK